MNVRGSAGSWCIGVVLLGLPMSVASAQWQKLTPLNDDELFTFGLSLAIDENTLVVGSPHADSMQGSATGSVCVYELQDEQWHLVQELVAEDGGTGDEFGAAVAIDGDQILVGAPQHNLHGAVFHFSRTPQGWVASGVLVAPAPTIDDQWGAAVSVHADLVAIGAPGADLFGADRGSASLFRASGGVWSQEATLTGSSTVDGGRLGSSIALSGDQLAVGNVHGSMYLFALENGSWVELVDAHFAGEAQTRVDIEDEFAAVGFPAHSQVESLIGMVAIYQFDGQQWQEQQILQPGDLAARDFFGQAVAISGDTMLIGRNGHDVACLGDPQCNAGSLSIYRWEGQSWNFQFSLLSPDVAPADGLGAVLALSGDTAVFRGPSGVYVHSLDSVQVEILPRLVDDGGVLEFRVTQGQPLSLATFALTGVDGAPPTVFHRFQTELLNGLGEWSFQADVPAGLSGVELAIQGFAFVQPDQPQATCELRIQVE